jgi:putative endonuclease
MIHKQLLGQNGEQWAVDFLINKGYSIIERNFRYKKAEIDIIAQKDKLLIFVEVKTRTNLQFGEPEEAVSRNKIRVILMGAESYIRKTDWHHDIRFDIIAIHSQSQPQILHIEDAFY